MRAEPKPQRGFAISPEIPVRYAMEMAQRGANSRTDRVGFAEKKASVVRRKCSRRGPGVIADKRLPAAIRHRREAATASKFFVLVAMDKEGWSNDAHGMIPMQDIHCVEPSFTPCVGQVLEVPAMNSASKYPPITEVSRYSESACMVYLFSRGPRRVPAARFAAETHYGSS